MALNLISILKAANYPQKEVDELAAKEHLLTSEEKFKLSETAWYLISQKYFMMLELEKSILFQEIEQGKRKYNPNDFEEVKTKLLHELTQKLQVAATESSLVEVRKQLEQFKPNTPPSVSTPPSYT